VAPLFVGPRSSAAPVHWTAWTPGSYVRHCVGGAPALTDFGRFLLSMRTPLTQNYQIWRGNTHGEEVCFQRVSHAPSQGAGPQHSPILGFPSIYAHILSHRNTNSDSVAHVGKGRVYCGQPQLPSQESGIAELPNFEDSPAYTLYRRTGVFYEGSHVIAFAQMRKCIAQFVSGSRVSWM